MDGHVRNPLVRAWVRAERVPTHPRLTWDEKERRALQWAAAMTDAHLLSIRGIGPTIVEAVRNHADARTADRIRRMAAGYFG